MATKNIFQGESDLESTQYGPKYLCAKFHNSNMNSTINLHSAPSNRRSSRSNIHTDSPFISAINDIDIDVYKCNTLILLSVEQIN